MGRASVTILYLRPTDTYLVLGRHATTYYLLPTTYYLPPTTYHLPPTTYFLLGIGRHLVQERAPLEAVSFSTTQ